MQPHKTILAQIAVEKSEEALKAAYNTLDISLPTAQNRAYYALFYIVTALAYLDDFVKLVKSHHKLMGYFNKYYIYEKKIFDQSLIKIYRKLIQHREQSDYNLMTELSKEQVLIDLGSAKTFILTVKPYVLNKLSEVS